KCALSGIRCIPTGTIPCCPANNIRTVSELYSLLFSKPLGNATTLLAIVPTGASFITLPVFLIQSSCFHYTFRTFVNYNRCLRSWTSLCKRDHYGIFLYPSKGL